MIGTRLGPYEIVEQIGEGGMATVYRAYQPSVDRFVAVKVMGQSISDEPEAMARFQREARVVARLEHVHVLPIYDFDGAHDPPYIVMRYLEGGTLKEVLRRGRIPLDEVGYLLRQVSAALDYAHRQGVVHRDVKPSNVLIDGEGNAYVSDFGIARMVGRADVGQGLTQSGSLLGTPGYMAPEQAMGQSVDHRADLYSLGVVLFEMLTGRLPYQAENLIEAVFKHVHEPVPSACALNADLPAAVDEVLRRAMAKDPAARYGTASEVAEAVVTALGGAVARTPRGLQSAAAESVRVIREQREERRDEIEATLARYSIEGRVGVDTDSQRTPTERNKLVTVLYANLAEVAEYVGEEEAEAARDTLERLWRRLEGVIAAGGGMMETRTYDTALALWGVEAAREDDPERAIRAALGMQAVLVEYLDEDEDDGPPPMQVGITTGLVLLTPSEEATGGLTASGATMSLVHRLERAAPPGGILISHDTYRHVRGMFDVEEGDPLRVRGRKRRLGTYLVRSTRPRAFRRGTRGVEGVETRMVGRQAELGRLQEAFYAAVEDSETQVVTVVSEPGLGKSRLLYEFTNWADLEEVEFWMARGRATPGMAQRPYALLRDLFSFRFGIQDSDTPAQVRTKLEAGIAQRMDPSAVNDRDRIAHFIGHLLGFDFSDSPHLAGALADAQGFHQEAQHHLTQFYLHACRRTPVLIQLADIHWADESSLDAIDLLVRRNPELPLLVVCLARPELYERRRAWGSGQSFHTRLELRPLSRRESRCLVGEILQEVDEVPHALRDLVVDRAEGNPFYIEELIKVLIDDRVIVREESAWRVELERLSGVRLPSTLTGLIQARLDGLFPSERAVLQRAAVVGRIFWDDAVRALEAADALAIDVGAALEDLAAREYVHVREASVLAGAGEYIFASNVLRDVILEGILGRQRRAYHALVAGWLIERGGERAGEYAGLVADHLEHAGEAERAIPYLRRAGERAAAQYANAEAVDYLSRALDLTPEENLAERYALLLARERVYDLQGMREAQHQDLTALEKLSEALADPRRQAEVAVRRTHYAHAISDYPAGVAAAQVAIHLAQTAQEAAIQVAGHLHYGQVLQRLGDKDAARLQYQRALSLARAAELHREEASSLNCLGGTLLGQGDHTRAEVYFQQALCTCRELGDRAGERKALDGLTRILLARGDHDAARECREATLRIDRQMGDRWSEGHDLWHLGFISYRQGDYIRAKGNYERSLPIFREIGDRWGEGMAIFNLGAILNRLGNYAGARPYLEQGLHIFHELGEKGGERLGSGYLCLLSHHLGDDETALEYGQEAVQIGPDVGLASHWCLVMTFLGHAQVGLGHLAEAADTYQQALRVYRKLDLPCPAAEVLAGLARVSLAQGDIGQAQAHVEEVLGCLEAYPLLRLGLVEELFRVYLTCYRVLRAVDDPRAEELLETAHRLLQERAAKIDDEDLRRSYLENVAAHREIVVAWNEERR